MDELRTLTSTEEDRELTEDLLLINEGSEATAGQASPVVSDACATADVGGARARAALQHELAAQGMWLQK